MGHGFVMSRRMLEVVAPRRVIDGAKLSQFKPQDCEACCQRYCGLTDRLRLFVYRDVYFV